jgi:hypothetical protein
MIQSNEYAVNDDNWCVFESADWKAETGHSSVPSWLTNIQDRDLVGDMKTLTTLSRGGGRRYLYDRLKCCVKLNERMSEMAAKRIPAH